MAEERVHAAEQQAEVPHVGSVEIWISNLLRYGVLISCSLVFVGTVLSFLHHPEYLSSGAALDRLTAPTTVPHSLSDVLAGTQAASGQALVMVGLLLLISIPVTRVAMSLIVFSIQKDRAFVTITSIVLTLLLLSFALGRATG